MSAIPEKGTSLEIVLVLSLGNLQEIIKQP